MSATANGAAKQHPEITSIIVGILGDIAPDVDPDDFDPTEDMRYELDIDSIDVLNLMIGIHEQLDIDVPEADYGRVMTLDGLVEYLVKRGANPPPS